MTKLLSILLMLQVTVGYAQNVSFNISDSLKGEFDNFSVDNFGRIYTTKEDVIRQYSSELDTLFTASLKSIRPSYIESSKSFRNLIFDYERSVIKFLDNTLTDVHDDIDLIDFDIQQPQIVCESFAGNGFWVYDGGASRLIKFDENLKQAVVTENIQAFLKSTAENLIPTQMIETSDYLYVSFPNYGVAIFDVFGTYINTYHTAPKRIDALGKNLIVLSELNTLEIIPMDGLLEAAYIYDIPVEAVDFAYTKQKVYFLTQKGITIGQYVLNK
ncbi:MAG: hypothetical protein ABJG68_11230 [Crocinitomicaceae bacterium]